MTPVSGGFSCLYVSAKNGHLEVVRALLEAGGRELLMLTINDGASCLFVSAENGHLEVVTALVEAGGRELLMLTKDNRDQLPICRTSGKPGGGLQGAGDGVPERRLVFARDHDPQARLVLKPF